MVKALGSTGKLPWILIVLSTVEVGGIHGVAVKCIDTMRNADREASSLDCN